MVYFRISRENWLKWWMIICSSASLVWTEDLLYERKNNVVCSFSRAWPSLNQRAGWIGFVYEIGCVRMKQRTLVPIWAAEEESRIDELICLSPYFFSFSPLSKIFRADKRQAGNKRYIKKQNIGGLFFFGFPGNEGWWFGGATERETRVGRL